MSETTTTRRFLVPVVGVVVIVALAAIIGILVSDDDPADTSTTPTTEAPVFAPVSVSGEALVQFTAPADDPAVGVAAPVLSGTDFSGAAVTTDSDRPQLLAFLAHWCPHCQAELPRIVEAMADGVMDRVRVVVVVTGSNPTAPNYPPAPWLADEGYRGEVLLDDEEATAGTSFGLSSYPFLVLVDSEGAVIARSAGELSISELTDFVDRAG